MSMLVKMSGYLYMRRCVHICVNLYMYMNMTLHVCPYVRVYNTFACTMTMYSAVRILLMSNCAI